MRVNIDSLAAAYGVLNLEYDDGSDEIVFGKPFTLQKPRHGNGYGEYVGVEISSEDMFPSAWDHATRTFVDAIDTSFEAETRPSLIRFVDRAAPGRSVAGRMPIWWTMFLVPGLEQVHGRTSVYIRPYAPSGPTGGYLTKDGHVEHISTKNLLLDYVHEVMVIP